MKRGDLVRIKDDAVPMFHDSNLSIYTLGGCGEVVVVVEPGRWAEPPGQFGDVFAQVLHPTVGVCYIRKQRLEAV